MAYAIDRLQRVELGRCGENLARRVAIDASTWLGRWPGARLEVLCHRPTESALYIPETLLDGAVLLWTVTAADTAFPGTGRGEVRAILGDVVVKSAVFDTVITPALEGTAGDPPAAGADWATDVIQAADRAEAASKQAVDAKQDAEAAAEQAEENVRTALQEAKDSGEFDGAPGEDGYTPIKGVDYFDGAPGTSGVYLGKEAPTDETVNVWIDPEGDAYYPIATRETLGGVKVGDGLTVDETGVLEAEIKRADLDKLSEEMAGQIAPESFGATGDGVTDDAPAITQALASARTVVFDGSKTYAVGSSIAIPADAYVDFRGAIIVPKGNHDVIQMKPGAHIENLIVRCTDVPGWDASALVFYGGDVFSASSPTRVNNVKLYNNMNFNVGAKKTGNGLYLYVDGIGQCLEGLAITDVATIGFNRGVYIYSTLPNEEDSPDKVFIGANNFRGYWSYRDCYGIYMDAPLPNNWMTNNFFTDLNVQSDYYGGSVYGIYCNGYENFFQGCLYDYSILSYHPETAVYFDYGAQRNTVEVTAGKVHSPSYCIDKGGYNDVVNIQHDDVFLPHARDRVGMIGNQDDVLAFVDKFGSCTLESLDSDPIAGELANVFDPTPWKRLAYRTPAENLDGARAIITINLPKVLERFSHFILQFGRSMPKNVKVTMYTATDTTVIYNRNDNTKDTIVVTPLLSNMDDVYDVVKIVVELGGVTIRNANYAYGEWAIERIMAVDSWNTGNTWLRRDGGKLCGNISFLQNTGPVLRDANGKTYMLTVSTEGVLGVTEYQEQEEETPEAAALIPVMMPRATWYNADASGADQSSITSVAFDAAYEPTGNEDASWACDDAGNGNIMAYRNGSAVVITPTTGSDKIQLNADSTYMFSNDGANAKFSSLASITGTEMWVADRETNMNNVCQGNTLITDPICIPEGVIYIQYAFNGCSALTTPPELPDGLISMLSAFGNCVALRYLPEIPSTVTNINYAFMTCKVATRAPSVVPAGVLKMTSAFRGCFSIDGTIEVNATNLNEYVECFLYVGTTSGAIVLTGSCPLLAELAATNTQGKVTVAS